MKKYLLPQNGQFYKANLHCHTNVSDGKLSPLEVKEQYMAHGYSIVAYTDHDVLVPHPELAEENFLPLNGYEIEINMPKDPTGEKPFTKCCHLCLVAIEPDNIKQVCWHREKYLFGNAPLYKDGIVFDENEPDFERVYTPECISEVMKRGREGGFFVTYNHPSWSLEDYNDYINYHGMHAMEIVNYGCEVDGFPDYNPRVYDDMLRAGKRIYCIAADDNHNRKDPDSPRYDSFGGFTMIKADKLEYRAITKALENGEFYASQGPEIKELWYENGKVHIECSAAQKIDLVCGKRRSNAVIAKDGNWITEAEFDIPAESVFFRLTVTDPTGKHANTNAFFLDEL